MTLYLTSNGLEDSYVAERFKKVILKKDSDTTSFLVISVQDNESDAFYLQKTKDELAKIGVTDIDVFELREAKFNTDREYDVIYVCGGNTFVYLDRIKKTGLDQFIVNSVRSSRSIYVGVSAGSIIAGPSIEIAGWGSQGDSNDVGLRNLEGLNLTNMIIYPHYTEELKAEVDEFKQKYGYLVQELKDNQALRLSYSNIDKLKNVLSLEVIKKNDS
ncbi:MAG: hypothetical protein EOM88_00290 [Clostridia bacterium]|nr:hypothetical protein [Clostridia bacterium]